MRKFVGLLAFVVLGLGIRAMGADPVAAQPAIVPAPVKYGKGKTISTAVDVLEELSGTHEVPRLVLD